jgi:hypothetical protein
MTLVYTVVPPPFQPDDSSPLHRQCSQGLGEPCEMSPHLANAAGHLRGRPLCGITGWIGNFRASDDVFDDDEGPIRGASPFPCKPPRTCFSGMAAAFRKGQIQWLMDGLVLKAPHD